MKARFIWMGVTATVVTLFFVLSIFLVGIAMGIAVADRSPVCDSPPPIVEEWPEEQYTPDFYDEVPPTLEPFEPFDFGPPIHSA